MSLEKIVQGLPLTVHRDTEESHLMRAKVTEVHRLRRDADVLYNAHRFVKQADQPNRIDPDEELLRSWSYAEEREDHDQRGRVLPVKGCARKGQRRTGKKRQWRDDRVTRPELPEMPPPRHFRSSASAALRQTDRASFAGFASLSRAKSLPPQPCVRLSRVQRMQSRRRFESRSAEQRP